MKQISTEAEKTPTITRKIGNTTFDIFVHFSDTSKPVKPLRDVILVHLGEKFRVLPYIEGGLNVKAVQVMSASISSMANRSADSRIVSDQRIVNGDSSYSVGGRTFLVERVFREDARETVGSILLRLLRTETDE